MNTCSFRARLVNALCSKSALLLVTLTCIIAVMVFVLPRHQVAYAVSGDWPTYLSDNGRSGYNPSETIINPGSAPHLKMHWSYKAGSFISTQPVEANGLIYWGSWDGYEHATRLNGTQVWQQSLGYTFSKNCNSQTGVASTAMSTLVWHHLEIAP